ncbi:hypothetical protein [Paraburkholderia caffeinilytica]|uniref:hypothetical protein n=1 Tax=Paraburkholderia caffeinilytica TaxID=1761016 RepID=UPI0038BB815C
MRYYTITLINPTTSQVLVPNTNPYGTAFVFSNDPTTTTWSSLNVGANAHTVGGSNPAALRVELDITSTPLHSPDSHAKPFIRIYGIPLSIVAQAADLNGMFISVSGGMAAGLPLANPNQSGLLVTGQVLQAVGEWVGTDMSLTLYLAPGGSSADYSNASGGASAMQPVTANTPANLTFTWALGQSMSTAIAQCLATAFPALNIQMSISDSLVWGSGVAKTAYFQNLAQFATFINETSKSILAGPNPASTIYAQNVNPAYAGVTIVLQGGTLIVQDFTTQTNPIPIAFLDLIGQPNWAAPGKVQLVTCMRGDITTSDFVQLPPALGTTSNFNSPNGGVSPLAIGNASNSPFKGNSAFTGVALVTKVRHLGDSRNASGLAWVSTYELVFQQPVVSKLLSAIPYVYKSSSGNSYGFTGGAS